MTKTGALVRNKNDSERPADEALPPPRAKRLPTTRTFHGDSIVDEYAWLRDRTDPDTVAYLEAENAYCAAATAHLQPLREHIFAEIKARTQESDLSAPVRQGDWWYYSRSEEGKQYPIHCRRRGEADDGTEQVLLDEKVLAGDSTYFRLGHFLVSPDGRLLAYSTDFAGGESYTLHFKDLAAGADLPDALSGIYYSGAWSLDGAMFFCVTHDAAMRPDRVWRHRLGRPQSEDALLHNETDERFFAGVRLTRSQRFILLELNSKITSEVGLLPATSPEAPFQTVEPRRQGVEYALAHHGDRFFLLHNDGAENFALAVAPMETPGRDHWSTVIPEREDTRLTSVHAFATHLVLHLRRDGRTGLRILPLDNGDAGDPNDNDFPEPVYRSGPVRTRSTPAACSGCTTPRSPRRPRPTTTMSRRAS